MTLTNGKFCLPALSGISIKIELTSLSPSLLPSLLDSSSSFIDFVLWRFADWSAINGLIGGRWKYWAGSLSQHATSTCKDIRHSKARCYLNLQSSLKNIRNCGGKQAQSVVSKMNMKHDFCRKNQDLGWRNLIQSHPNFPFIWSY